MVARVQNSTPPLVPSDAQGNRDPSAGSSPGYDEQLPANVAAARQPGGRNRPHNEEGGVRRDVSADASAESKQAATLPRTDAPKSRAGAARNPPG